MYDLHIHSNFSDGRASIDLIARKAKEKGLKVIAIVDHSLEHKYGLNERKARKRQNEIEKAKSKYDIEILGGIECGIGADGEILKPSVEFDLVLVAVHEILPASEYYRRIELCIQNNDVNILSHFHSQMFCSLDGRNIAKDLEIVDKLIENDVAIELNSLHLAPPEDLLKLLPFRKIKYSIGSDSHTLERVGDVKWCLRMAKKYLSKSKFII